MDFNAIIQRAKKIIINPAEEWQVIKEEPENKSEVIKNYALPFIILVTIATFLGNLIFTNYLNVGFMVANAAVTFIGLFLAVYISAYLINELAPGFESKKDIDAAFKLVIYSYTAVFISQTIANLIPPLFFMAIFGLYSVYLLWLGFGPMMRTPGNKKASYVTVSAIIIFVAYTLLTFLLGTILTMVFVSTGMNTIT